MHNSNSRFNMKLESGLSTTSAIAYLDIIKNALTVLTPR